MRTFPAGPRPEPGRESMIRRQGCQDGARYAGSRRPPRRDRALPVSRHPEKRSRVGETGSQRNWPRRDSVSGNSFRQAASCFRMRRDYKGNIASIRRRSGVIVLAAALPDLMALRPGVASGAPASRGAVSRIPLPRRAAWLDGTRLLTEFMSEPRDGRSGGATFGAIEPSAPRRVSSHR